MNKNYFIIALLTSLTLAGCDDITTADRQQHEQQEQLSRQSNMAAGMPAIIKFSEKKMMKDILELRDKTLPTYTYLVGELNGTIGEKVCDSVGYGLPGATQYTNPSYVAYTAHETGVATLPQADPNGLYSPPAEDATWVMCRVPGTDTVMPQYIEGRVITLTFPKEARK